MITFVNSVKISKFALFSCEICHFFKRRQTIRQQKTAMKLGTVSTRILIHIRCELQLHISTGSLVMGSYVHSCFSENAKSENHTSADLPWTS